MNANQVLLVSEESLLKLQVESANWNGYKDYIDDYKNIMKQKEILKIPFAHQSPQIFYRKSIINYLKEFAITKQLSHACLHLAVYMLDIFMDNHSILPARLYLVADVCLLLAAKFEEANNNIPKFEELNKSSKQNNHSLNEYRLVEIIVLKFFHWYLMIPTPAHYIHYFMQTILEKDDVINEKNSYYALMCDLQEYIKLYLDKMIDDIHLMQLFSPSKLAAGAISAARIQMGFTSWTGSLEKFTGYSKEQVLEITKLLIQKEHVVCANCIKPANQYV